MTKKLPSQTINVVHEMAFIVSAYDTPEGYLVPIDEYEHSDVSMVVYYDTDYNEWTTHSQYFDSMQEARVLALIKSRDGLVALKERHGLVLCTKAKQIIEEYETLPLELKKRWGNEYEEERLEAEKIERAKHYELTPDGCKCFTCREYREYDTGVADPDSSWADVIPNEPDVIH